MNDILYIIIQNIPLSILIFIWLTICLPLTYFILKNKKLNSTISYLLAFLTPFPVQLITIILNIFILDAPIIFIILTLFPLTIISNTIFIIGFIISKKIKNKKRRGH